MKQQELGGEAFGAAAARELERIMALSVSEAVPECNGIRAELRSALSFNLPVSNLTSSTFLP